MGLGDRLQKTLDEIVALGPEEIALYLAFYGKHHPDKARETRTDYRFGLLASELWRMMVGRKVEPAAFFHSLKELAAHALPESDEDLERRAMAGAVRAKKPRGGGV